MKQTCTRSITQRKRRSDAVNMFCGEGMGSSRNTLDLRPENASFLPGPLSLVGSVITPSTFWAFAISARLEVSKYKR